MNLNLSNNNYYKPYIKYNESQKNLYYSYDNSLKETCEPNYSYDSNPKIEGSCASYILKKEKLEKIKEYKVISKEVIVQQNTFSLPVPLINANNSLLSLRDPDNPQSYMIK